jgi:DNA polymerase-3 subunit alpha
MGAREALARLCECSLSELKELADGDLRVVGGVVTAFNRRYTKRGDLMATFILEDLEAAVEVMVFPRTMADYGHLLAEDAIVCVKARLDLREDVPKLIAMEVRRPELVDGGGPPVRLRVPAGHLTESLVAEVKRVLLEHPGDSPVFLHVEDGRRTTVLRLGPGYCVDAGNGLHAELRVLLGADAVF